MMRKWFAIFITIFSLTLMAIGAGAHTFYSSNGYSITAPAGWSFSKHGMSDDDVVIITKPHDSFSDNLNVRIIASPAGTTLEQVQIQLKSSYPRMFQGYKVISDRFESVGGQHAYELLCNHKFGTPTRTLWVRQDIVIRSGKLYVFTCTALASNASRSASAFDTIIKSVHWTSK